MARCVSTGGAPYGQQLTAVSARKLRFLDTRKMPGCVWEVRLRLSSHLFNVLVRGVGFPDTYSIPLRCLVEFIYNIVIITPITVTVTTILKKHHKVAMGLNNGMLPSFLTLSGQNTLFLFKII